MRIDNSIPCGYNLSRKRALSVDGLSRKYDKGSNRKFGNGRLLPFYLLFFVYRNDKTDNSDNDQCILIQFCMSYHMSALLSSDQRAKEVTLCKRDKPPTAHGSAKIIVPYKSNSKKTLSSLMIPINIKKGCVN